MTISHDNTVFCPAETEFEMFVYFRNCATMFVICYSRNQMSNQYHRRWLFAVIFMDRYWNKI